MSAVPPSERLTELPQSSNLSEPPPNSDNLSLESLITDDDDSGNLSQSSRDSLGSIGSLGRLSSLDIASEDPGYLLPEAERGTALSALQDPHTSSVYMSFMNMANSIIGAGIIGQPYAMLQAGLFAGVSLLLGLTVVIDWTIRLIVVNAKLSGADSYQGTVAHCFGTPGRILVQVAQLAFAFGGSMAFCVIIGDTIPHVINAFFPNLHSVPVLRVFSMRNPLIVVFTLGVSYPLSLNRDISKLAHASGFALISMLIIITIVVVRAPQLPSDLKGHLPVSSLFINSGIFQAVSVISFAFVCHHNSLFIYGALRKPTLDRFSLVTHLSTGISMVGCLVMALAGFLCFGDDTKGNILNNFPASDTWANVARFCFGLNMLTTLPLEIFVCRAVIQDLLAMPELPPVYHFGITSVLVCGAMIVALLTCNLGAILELAGASSASILAYILPPLCYAKLSAKPWREKVGCYVCAAFGVLVMVVSTVMTLASLGKDSGDHCVV